MKHPYILTIVTLFCISTIVGGCKTLLQAPINAKSAYESKQYNIAADLLNKDYDKETDLIKKSDIAYKIGECYRMANKTSLAETWYFKALDYSTDPTLVFKYAQMLKANNKYTEAIRQFNEYSLSHPIDRTRATREIQMCKQASEWLNKPLPYRITNLSAINSNASDFAPVLYKNNQLIITSARNEASGTKLYGWTGEKHTDIFSSSKKNNFLFDTPIAFGDSINTSFNEGTPTFTADFKEMYFTACGTEQAKNDYCQIYHTRQTAEGKWSLPELFELFDADTINVGQPYITPNAAQLYFSSDAPEGYGDKDIYVVNKQDDGTWSEPKNLGPEINTEGYDGFPYLAPNGKFYFASNGHLGLGGLDIYCSTRKGKNWQSPENMQSPINSPADDFGIFFEPFVPPVLLDSIDAIGYFASSRAGGKGNDDIYQFVLSTPPPSLPDTTPVVKIDTPKIIEKPKPIIWLQGTIYAKTLQNPNNPNSAVVGKTPIPNAVTQIFGTDTKSNFAKRIVSSEKGTFGLAIEENSDYRVSAQQAGYFSKSENVSSKNKNAANTDTLKIYVEIILDKIYKQKEIVIDNIYYDLDKFDIRTDAQPILDKLAYMLIENPNISIELGSHTDSRGSDRYNTELSQKRAESVVNYLANKGIIKNRLIPKGWGETQLVNECKNGVNCTEEQHQQNRRTTFKVTSDRFNENNSGF